MTLLDKIRDFEIRMFGTKYGDPRVRVEQHSSLPDGWYLMVDKDGYYGFMQPGSDYVHNGEGTYSKQEAIESGWSLYNYNKRQSENKEWERAV